MAEEFFECDHAAGVLLTNCTANAALLAGRDFTPDERALYLRDVGDEPSPCD